MTKKPGVSVADHGIALFSQNAAQSLERDEQFCLLANAVAHQNDMLIIFKIDEDRNPDTWRILYANEAYLRTMGYSLDEILGDSPPVLHGLKTDQAHIALFRQAMIDGKAVRAELLCYTKLRSELWFDINVTPIDGPDGGAKHFVAVLRDVTERRQLIEQIARSEERFQMVAKATNDVIWDADLIGGKVWFNQNFRKVIGSEPALSQQSATEFYSWIHPDDLDRVMTYRSAALASKGTTFQLEYRVRKADSSYALMEVCVEVTRDDSNKPTRIVGAMADVTERRAMAERLQQLQLLEAIGKLTGGIAHDFNNLLTVILGNAELLEEQLKGEPNLEKIAVSTAAMALRGADLTKRLLAFAQRQPLRPKAIDFGKTLFSIQDVLRSKLPEGINIQVSAQPDLWKVELDPALLENALLNLAFNARDAMPQGGRLLIEAINCDVTEEEARQIVEAAPGRHLRISVSDTGTGMDAATLARAFEPFFTTKKFGKSSGLGLSMVYGFLRQSSGFAVINSTLGKGTEVHLYFPRLNSQDTLPQISVDVGPIEGGSEHILVVDDDPSLLPLAVQLLETLGYQTSSASSGTLALQMLKDDPSIQILFTDVVMPSDLSGPELVDLARPLRPDLKFLYTSGYSEEAIVEIGGPQGGLSLLSKPYTLRELSRTIRRVLNN